MARRPVDPKVAKARRQKKIAIGGSVALVLLLAVQVPKTLKMMNPEPTAAPPAVSTTTSTTVPSAPAGPLATPAAAGTTTPMAAVTGLPDTGALPVVDQGQLVSFERFASKDPFSQQVSITGGSPDTADDVADLGTLPAKPDGAAGGAAGTKDGTGDTGFSPGAGTGGTTTATPVATATTISINGEAEAVAVEADFPAAGPLFTLAKLGKDGKSVEIGVAGGKLATGGATVTLTRGKPLTLMNTADGTRYTLVLLAVEGF